MRIIFSGGGTLGPVMPLLAVANIIKEKYSQAELIWVGTKNGPERAVVEKSGLKFIAFSGGKLRRYFSVWNILDVFVVAAMFIKSLFFLRRLRPRLLITAGGFVSVPLHWAGALLRVKTWVHQQDVKAGLANRLMMMTATKVTTALKETAASLKKYEARWIGNPTRALGDVDKIRARQLFGIPAGAPVIFALGGGTGSAQINRLVAQAIAVWPKDWQIVHLVGKDRPDERAQEAAKSLDNYRVYEFFNQEEMAAIYAVADVVITRAGFSTLSELAMLKKAAVIVPMPRSHQENNAAYFGSLGGAIVLAGEAADGLKLARIVKDLLADQNQRSAYGERLNQILPPAKKEDIVALVDGLLF